MQNQTLKEIEIILVNDGSPDNCLSICKEYAERDKRIKIVDKVNGGTAFARNQGVKIATGEYFGFVDPDDWIEPDMYENMYRKISESSADICMCDYIVENKNKVKAILLNIEADTIKRKEIVEKILPEIVGACNLDSGSSPIMAAVWRLLISKRFIDNNNNIFMENIIVMDDLIYYLELLLHAEKICIEKGQYYHYITHYESTVNRYRENIIQELDHIFKKMNEVLLKENCNQIIKRRLDIRYVNMRISIIVNILHKDNNAKIREKIKMIVNICNDEKLKQILSTIDTKGYTFRKKAVLYAIKNELAFYLFLYYSLVSRLK